MGTSAPPKNKPYEPIYGDNTQRSISEMLFPSSALPPTAQVAPNVRPSVAMQPERTQIGRSFVPVRAQVPTTTQSTAAPNSNHEQQIAYAMRLLNPELYRK